MARTAKGTKKSAASKKSSKSAASNEQLLEYYRQMLLIRRFEEKAGQLYGIAVADGQGCPDDFAVLAQRDDLSGPAQERDWP